MAPEADETSQRKLARRILGVQLQAGVAELSALAGNPLKRPRTVAAQPIQSAVAELKASPLLSLVAAMYAEERVTRNAWSAKTALQNRNIFDVIVDLLGDRPIAEVTKEDMRRSEASGLAIQREQLR